MDHPIIDSHHHLWPLEAVPDQAWQPAGQTTLRRAFEPQDLRPELTRAGVTGTVLMQSVDGPEENERLVDYGRSAADVVRGIVAWAPLESPPEALGIVEDVSARAATAGVAVVGVRRLVGTDPMAWAVSPGGLSLFRELASTGLVWDVVPITEEQRDTVVQVAEAVPELRIVVDHLGSPPRADDDPGPWVDGLRRMAACPNIAVKLSVGVAVLSRAGRWSAEDIGSWTREALAAFGPERSMLASNWPVVLLQTDYAQAWRDTADAVAAAVPAAQAPEVLGGTAALWYGLEAGDG